VNVHLALLGRSKNPVLKGFQYYNMDKLYLLHSPDTPEYSFQQTAEEVQQNLATVGFTNVQLVQIDPFDMYNIINTILHIVDNEQQANIFINITGGTNLMSGAACSASFFIGAQAYYILDENKLPTNSTLKSQIIELPIPRIPYIKTLQDTQMKILHTIHNNDGTITNTQLRHELQMSPQKTSYHIKELHNKGFIILKRGHEEIQYSRNRQIKKIDNRRLVISLSNSGKLVASWTNKGR